MIQYNEFLILLREKNFKNKGYIFRSIGRVRVEFDPKIYEFFGFGSRKSCSESKISVKIQIGSIFDRSTYVYIM